MSKPSDSHSGTIKSNSLKPNNRRASQEKVSFLKLVVSNPAPLQKISPSEAVEPNKCAPFFTVDVRVKGPCLYDMAIHDPAHYLKCNLILEVEESNEDYEGGTVICHFPNLFDEELNDFVEEDETLYGALMVQFQIKILEQLLLFCATHYASTLVIFADVAQADTLGVYQDFLTYKDQRPINKGEKTEMVIPADRKTFEAWVDFMREITTNFYQILWHDQGSNPVIRRYLKSQSLVVSAK